MSEKLPRKRRDNAAQVRKASLEQRTEPPNKKRATARKVAPSSVAPVAPVSPDVWRCRWVDLYTGSARPESVAYHDQEWGVPVHDDRTLFEFLCLEGAQAGLSWVTVLQKRAAYREAFCNFDPVKVAALAPGYVEGILNDKTVNVIHNRLKLQSVVTNAKATLCIQAEFKSLDNFLWGFVDHATVQSHRLKMEDMVSTTPVAEKMSKELKRRGFRFIGPTICYAFMQAVGMVNDHLTSCYRHDQLV
jgi:DNA-3-methyladenine glycosylase I